MKKFGNQDVRVVNPGPTIEVHLQDGRVLEGPRGVSIGEFLMSLPEAENPLIVGAVVNGALRELTYPLTLDAVARPVTLVDSDGARIYRRSLTFLLDAAFEGLFPKAELSVDHSVASGGFFCAVSGRPPLSVEELRQLESHMHDLVSEDLPFERKEVPLEEAVDYFAKKGQNEKVRLLKFRTKSTLVLYSLKEHRDYHHGYMLPSTGFIRYFALLPLQAGFILQFPRRHAPQTIQTLPDTSKLLETFLQYGSWLNRLEIEDVGALNEAVQNNRIREAILVSEALHEHRIAEIASRIVESEHHPRIILVAGPSSSGKTTFSKRLSIQLLAQGLDPYPVELDNYFVNRDMTPKDKHGQYDFESLNALDIALLSEHLGKMISGETVQIPIYDFILGTRNPGIKVQLKDHQVIILEGIHGLNPKLLQNIPQDITFRIYVSALTQLNLDRHNRISTTDTRLIRRIVRDARERGYSATQTIGRWESVRRGEKEHIFPFQEFASEMFNSALVYEVAALKPLAEPLLRQVPFGTDEYIEAKRLLAFLDWFLPLDTDLIPDNSIIREFIGGSILKDFKIWE